jgi:hypothetical protein
MNPVKKLWFTLFLLLTAFGVKAQSFPYGAYRIVSYMNINESDTIYTMKATEGVGYVLINASKKTIGVGIDGYTVELLSWNEIKDFDGNQSCTFKGYSLIDATSKKCILTKTVDKNQKTVYSLYIPRGNGSHDCFMFERQ